MWAENVKINDKIRIRKFLDMKNQYGINKFDKTCIACKAGFTEDMMYLCGNIYIIININVEDELILNDFETMKWTITRDMIEPV